MNKFDEITIDFETFSKLDLTKVAAWNYSKHNSTVPLILSYKFGNGPTKYWDCTQGFNLPKELHDRLSDHSKPYRLIAHNYWFEFCIWNNCCIPKYNWPEIPDEWWFDTQYQCGMSAIPFKLELACKALKLTHLKLDTGKALIELFSMPQKNGHRIMPEDKPKQWEEFITYCIGDTEATWELYITLLMLKDEELEYAHLTHKLNLQGIPVDTEAAKIILPKVEKEREQYSIRLTDLTDGIITKVTQTIRMKRWFANKYDLELPNFAAETVEALIEGKYGELPSEGKAIAEMRYTGGKSSTAKYEKLLNTVGDDDYIRGTLLYHGARTGRYAGYDFQPQNLPKPSVDVNTRKHVLFDFENLSKEELTIKYLDYPIIDIEAKDKDLKTKDFNKKYVFMEHLIYDLKNFDNDYINMKYGSFMRAASTAVRGMVKAPYGMMLYGADYAAIEARVVFWLANCLRGLKLYHEGFDLYKDMATVIYKVLYDNVNEEQRWLGKQAILGCGYGLGWKGFINSCAMYGQVIGETLSRNTVDAYRERYPEVPKLWNDLDKKSILAVKSGHQTFAANGRISFKSLKHRNGMTFLYMKLPSGRLLSYPDVKLQKTTTPWGAKRLSVTYKISKDRMWLRDSTYGGKLTENACQAIARDIMMYGAKNAAAENIFTIFQVHDELISIAEANKVPLEEYENMLCNPMPDWAKGLPLNAEGKLLTRYQKL